MEKVKAHDHRALALGHPKATGNDLADRTARAAATSPQGPLFDIDLSPFSEPVELLDAVGSPVFDVQAALQNLWWGRRQQSRSTRRPWLDQLYPPDVPLDWSLSTAAFRRPTVSGDTFIHPSPPHVVKWLARARAGCLASRFRLFKHHLGPSPTCPCCGADSETEEHMVCGCPVTGSADWLLGLLDVWASTARSLSMSVPPPPSSWLQQFRLPLLMALIPSSLSSFIPLAPALCRRFLARLHLSLAAQLAEWMRRREAVIASTSAQPASGSSDAPISLLRPCPLPPERQLLPADLRRLERQRHSISTAQSSTVSASPGCISQVAPQDPIPQQSIHGCSLEVPPTGEPRRRWLRSRLEQLLREETIPCSLTDAVPALDFLALFEMHTN